MFVNAGGGNERCSISIMEDKILVRENTLAYSDRMSVTKKKGSLNWTQVGTGVFTIERAYVLTLGANIGKPPYFTLVPKVMKLFIRP